MGDIDKTYEMFKELGAIVDEDDIFNKLLEDDFLDDEEEGFEEEEFEEEDKETDIEKLFKDDEEIIKEIQKEQEGIKETVGEEIKEIQEGNKEKASGIKEVDDKESKKIREGFKEVKEKDGEGFKGGLPEDSEDSIEGVGGVYKNSEGDMGFIGGEVKDKDFIVDDLEEKEVTRDDLLNQMESDVEVKERDVLYDSEGRPVEFQVDGEIYTEYISLDEILIPPRTRRVQNSDIESLEKLILQWGLIEPLHVIPFNGRYLLVHGFRRYRALKNLGYDKVICLVDTTRPKTTVRFLEVIQNNIEKYNFFEVMDFGEFIERKQKTFQNNTIENIIGMEPGDYLKAKYIRQFDRFGIIGEILSGKRTIKEGFKKLERELEKIEKEQQELALENFDEQGLPESYLEYIEEEAELQTTDNRHPLPKHISDRIKARDKYTCQSCGLGYHQPELISVFEVHHIVPVFKGGRDEDSNLILTCSNCHKVIHAYSEGKFNPPEGRVRYYTNMILLGNIIKRGLPDDRAAYRFYMDECEQSWVEE